jgi:hypothetical protein
LLAGRALRGFNVHHCTTVFVQPVDLNGLAGTSTTELGPEFATRFLERFPGARAEGTVEEALLEATLAVERTAVHSMRRLDTVAHARIRPLDASPGLVELVWSCQSPSLSRVAARVAFAGLLELLPETVAQRPLDSEKSFERRLRRLLRRSRRRQLSETAAAIALAARERGVPCEPLAGAYLRLGEGVLQHTISSSDSRLSRDGKATLDLLFPLGAPATVPSALVVGQGRAASIAQQVDAFLRAGGRSVGLATNKRTTIAGQPVDPTSIGREGGARFVLGDPRVDLLVCALSPKRIVDRGLRVGSVTVTALLDPEPEGDAPLYRRGIEVAVAATTGAIVARAGHPCLEKVERDRLILIGGRRENREVRRHLQSGGRAVLRVKDKESERIVLRRGDETIVALPADMLRPRIGRAMYVVAIAFALDAPGFRIELAARRQRFLRR